MVVAAQQPPQQQDEFIPLDQLPPQEQMPAAPLLIGAYAFVMVVLFLYVLSVARRLASVQQEISRLDSSDQAGQQRLMPTAAHFLYIPGVLLLGIVIGWILGSRAAADAYAAQLQAGSNRSRRPDARA